MVYCSTWYILFHILYNIMEEEVKVVETEAVEEAESVEEVNAEEVESVEEGEAVEEAAE